MRSNKQMSFKQEHWQATNSPLIYKMGNDRSGLADSGFEEHGTGHMGRISTQSTAPSEAWQYENFVYYYEKQSA
jgi:hypothetical protein